MVAVVVLLGCSDPFAGAVYLDGKPLAAVNMLHAGWNLEPALKPATNCDPMDMKILLADDSTVEALCPPYCAPNTPPGDRCPLGNAGGCYIHGEATAVIHMDFDLTQVVVHEAAHRLHYCAGYDWTVNNGHQLAAVWSKGGLVPSVQEMYE